MSPDPPGAAPAADDLELAQKLLAELVALAATNLEDPPNGRYEKPNYRKVAEHIAGLARAFGLSARVVDPSLEANTPERPHHLPTPNVIVDLDVGARSTVLILAHFDVVPVPAEQLSRWQSPPHTLTARADGRWYGRGSNDDLGSGVVASLLAMRRLALRGGSPRNVRLLACCDEETGGAGGVESLKAHDDHLPPSDPGRFLRGDVALIPDGSEHATAGSSGVAFLDASFARPVGLREALDYGDALVRLHDRVRRNRSRYASPDWPDHGAPEPVLTGRATVTQVDLARTGPAGGTTAIRTVHAESDAANQIPEAVTLVFDGPSTDRDGCSARLAGALPPPFRLATTVRSAVAVPEGAWAVQVVGLSGHGGYPHRAQNPVPQVLALLRRAVDDGWIAESRDLSARFTVDLRLVPEADLATGREDVLDAVRGWAKEHSPDARIDAPPGRSRGGYALAPDDPNVRRLSHFLSVAGGASGIFGEYGGTDASSLSEVRTPSGAPLPAVVFGSMDRAARIHEAEESVDPRLLRAVAETIYRFVLDA